MRMILDACKRGVAAVVVTHDAHLASWADRTIFLSDGRVVDHMLDSSESSLVAPRAVALMPEGVTMSTAVLTPLADSRPADGGTPARRAVVRWAWRLFRREWRQQFLILALITVAVAATIVGSAVATNDPPPKNAGFGTAQDSVSFTSSTARTAAVIASLEQQVRPRRGDRERDVVDSRIDQHLSAPGTGPARPLRWSDAHARLRSLPVRCRPGRSDEWCRVGVPPCGGGLVASRRRRAPGRRHCREPAKPPR